MQVSATSQTPAAGRQTVPERRPSAGQFALVPVHVSTASQTSAAGRQTAVAGRKPLGGQVPLAAVQVSATSQGPAACRQTAPGLGDPVHVTPGPLQVSFDVQMLPSLHGVVRGTGEYWHVPVLAHSLGRSQPGGSGQVTVRHWMGSQPASPGRGTHVSFGPPQMPLPPTLQASTVQTVPSPTY